MIEREMGQYGLFFLMMMQEMQKKDDLIYVPHCHCDLSTAESSNIANYITRVLVKAGIPEFKWAESFTSPENIREMLEQNKKLYINFTDHRKKGHYHLPDMYKQLTVDFPRVGFGAEIATQEGLEVAIGSLGTDNFEENIRRLFEETTTLSNPVPSVIPILTYCVVNDLLHELAHPFYNYGSIEPFEFAKIISSFKFVEELKGYLFADLNETTQKYIRFHNAVIDGRIKINDKLSDKQISLIEYIQERGEKIVPLGTSDAHGGTLIHYTKAYTSVNTEKLLKYDLKDPPLKDLERFLVKTPSKDLINIVSPRGSSVGKLEYANDMKGIVLDNIRNIPNFLKEQEERYRNGELTEKPTIRPTRMGYTKLGAKALPAAVFQFFNRSGATGIFGKLRKKRDEFEKAIGLDELLEIIDNP